jgi:hypothetical protein
MTWWPIEKPLTMPSHTGSVSSRASWSPLCGANTTTVPASASSAQTLSNATIKLTDVSLKVETVAVQAQAKQLVDGLLWGYTQNTVNHSTCTRKTFVLCRLLVFSLKRLETLLLILQQVHEVVILRVQLLVFRLSSKKSIKGKARNAPRHGSPVR